MRYRRRHGLWRRWACHRRVRHVAPRPARVALVVMLLWRAIVIIRRRLLLLLLLRSCRRLDRSWMLMLMLMLMQRVAVVVAVSTHVAQSRGRLPLMMLCLRLVTLLRNSRIVTDTTSGVSVRMAQIERRVPPRRVVHEKGLLLR